LSIYEDHTEKADENNIDKYLAVVVEIQIRFDGMDLPTTSL